MRRLRARALVPLLVLGTAAILAVRSGGVGAADETVPLRNEDVVRMLVSGASVRSVIDAIEGSPADFDLADDMVVELRLAGVPDRVIEAMRSRMEALRPEPAEPGPVEPGESSRIEVRLVAEDGPKDDAGRPVLLFPDRLTDAMADALRIPREGDRQVTDLALFLACATGEHVPDQWRSRSPLGRDFVTMPRHGILDFRPGARRLTAREALGWFRGLLVDRKPDGDAPGFLSLEIPDSLGAASEPGERHDLLAGVAVEVGGRYLALAVVRWDGVEAEEGGEPVLELRSGVERSGFRPFLEAREATPPRQPSPGPR